MLPPPKVTARLIVYVCVSVCVTVNNRRYYGQEKEREMKRGQVE